MNLEGKIVIVTGAGSGIGQATAKLFACRDAKVVVVDYDAKTGEDTARGIEESGGEAVFVGADVSNSAQVEHLAQVALDTYGGIDVLFNNAGALFFGTVLDTTEDDWIRIISTNLTSTFLCSRAVIPYMVGRGGGAIINVTSSTGAHDAAGNSAAYVASKGGVALLTKAMAIDHAADNVRVNAIAPGPTDTPMLRHAMTPLEIERFSTTFPMQRLGRPEEIARAVLFLASEEASFVTGTILAVDGGQTAQV